MYCRLIKQKGVIEFLEAAELVYKKNKKLLLLPIVDTQLADPLDSN